MRILLALLVTLAALPMAASAATILVYVEESGGPDAAEDPHPVRDGLLGGLFDRGQIVFDTGEAVIGDVTWDRGDSPTLRGIATEGGASLILVVRATLRSVGRESGAPIVEASLTYSLLDLSEPEGSMASGDLYASNRGKEAEVDALAVAHGVGADLAATVHALLTSAGY